MCVSKRGAAGFGKMTALVVTTPAGLEGEARRELCTILAGSQVRSLPLKGNILLLSDAPEREALERIAGADTRCVSRLVAVQRRLGISSDAACFCDVARAAARVGRIEPGETFLVRCNRRGSHNWRGRDLERSVARELEEATGARGDYDAPVDWRVSVEVYQDVAYVGVNRPRDLVHKGLRKQRKYAPGQRPLNRAQLKLREAIDAFGITLPDGARVVDLGSAPGGWAAVLAVLAGEVVAVDPAALAPQVEALSNVQHWRCRAEDLVDRDDLRERFDLMTCDMNVDPAECAETLCQLASLLKAGAPAVMTVKYVSRRRRQHEREAREKLAREYEGIRMRHLPHNALETTAFMRRRG